MTAKAKTNSSPGPDATVLDLESIRADFPILHQQVNGKPLVYLDNAASAQRPRAVIQAVSHYYEHDHANVHRGVHTLSQRATDAYEAARETARSFINAAETKEIVFVRGTTEAVNLVAQSFARPRLQAGDEIIVSRMEHHSNIVPWQLLCEQTGARLLPIDIDKDGALDMDHYARALGPRTRMVSLIHVSNALGTINPVRKVVELAQDKGIPVMLDGAQAVPHMSVDVRALGCDFYAFSGHKMFGPTGIGVLYGRAELLAAMPPWQGGGEMIRTVRFDGSTFADIPARFEAGTPHIAGAVGLAAAMRYMNDTGVDAIAAHEAQLLAYANQQLAAIPGLRFIGTAPERASVVSFVLDGVHPHDIGTILDHHGVAVRTGHHCAMPVMEFFDVPATARASFAFYNTLEEIDALVAALHDARGMFA